MKLKLVLLVALIAAVVVAATLVPSAANAELREHQQYELNTGLGDTFWQFSFVHITDLHIGEGFDDYGTVGHDDSPPEGDVGQSAERLRTAVDWVNANKDINKIEFVMVTGDLTDSAEKSEFFKCKEILDALEIPYVPIIGNHDTWPYYKDASGDWQNSYSPNGDQYFREVFGGHLDDLRDSGFFARWDDGTRDTAIWNGEADTLGGTDEGCYSYFTNFAFDYAGYHFICTDFNTRDRALLGEPGALPNADLFDSDLCQGTWSWFKDHFNNYPYKAADNMLIFMHQPLTKHPIYMFVCFSPIEYGTVTSFLNDNSYKYYTGLCCAGHIHRNSVYDINTIIKDEGDSKSTICPGVETATVKDDSDNIRVMKVWGKTLEPNPSGAILYQHSDFGGRGELFVAEDPSLGNNPIGNDEASSLRIMGAGSIELYKHSDYQGDMIEFNTDVNSLSLYGFNDETSSVKFKVTRITEVSPDTGIQTQVLDVTITGEYTNFVDGVSEADFGEGITVDNPIMVDSPTQATANITIAADATPGIRDVTVTTGSEVAVGECLFEVLASPWIDNLDPTIGYQGSLVTINGSDFGDTQEENSYVTFQRSGSCGPSVTKTAQVISWSDSQIVVRVPSGLCCKWCCCVGCCGTCGSLGPLDISPISLPPYPHTKISMMCWRCLLGTHCYRCCCCCLSTALYSYCPVKVRVHRMGVESNYEIFRVRCWPIFHIQTRPIYPYPGPTPR